MCVCTNEITGCFLKRFDEKINAICADCNRRPKIARLLRFLSRLDMRDLIYASNIYTLLTTSESGVSACRLLSAKTSVTEGE